MAYGMDLGRVVYMVERSVDHVCVAKKHGVFYVRGVNLSDSRASLHSALLPRPLLRYHLCHDAPNALTPSNVKHPLPR